MEGKEFKKYEQPHGIITVHSLKQLDSLDYALDAARTMYEALVDNSNIRDAIISIKAVTADCYRVEVSSQVYCTDEEHKKYYEQDVTTE